MAELNRLRNIQVSAATKETTYGTAVAVDSLIKCEQASIVTPDPQIVNNQDLLGATQEADDQEIVAMAQRLAFNQPRAKPHTVAFTGSYGLGAVATTTPDGATNARKHTITPVNAVTLSSFTVEGLLKSGLQKKYAGGGISDFALRIQRGANRKVALSSNILLCGSSADGTATESEISEAALNAGSQCGVWLGATTYSGTNDDDLDYTTTDLTSASDIASTVRSIEWSVNNNPDPEELYRLGSGLYLGAFERGDLVQTVNLDYDYADETEVERLTNQTAVAFQVKIRGAEIETGFYYGMNLIFPKLKYAGVERAVDRGKLVNRIRMQVLEDATYGSVILVVFNIQTAYAAAA